MEPVIYCEYKNNKIDKQTYEPIELFLERIDFIVKGLEMGYEFDKILVLSHVYLNKQLYGVSYSSNIEEKIQTILLEREEP